ncbi:MAG: redoxin family protein [Planctomycetota bacterium]
MRIAITLAALGLLAVPALARLGPQDTAKVGAKIPAFTATAVATVDSKDVKVPTAYMIIGVNCGATPGYEKRFKAVEDEFRAKGVDFFWVFPNKTETLEQKQAWMKKLGLKGGMIDDVGAKITKALEFTNTAAVVLTDKDGNIVYRGGIDDSRDEAGVKRRHLAEAIKEVLAGKPVSFTTSRAPG